jgi:hypothetical protein
VSTLAELAHADGAAKTIEKIVPSEIGTDPRVNTRQVHWPWVHQIVRAGTFDPHAIGTPAVSARPDGTMIWLDGQNRGALLGEMGLGDQPLETSVYRGLTIDGEAILFLLLNNGRQVSAVAKYRARVTAGDPGCVAIDRIVTDAGWLVGDTTSPTTISAVGALTAIYLGDRRSPRPGELDLGFALERTLAVVTAAWGHDPAAVGGEVLKGIGAVFNHHWGAVEVAHLTERLGLIKHGPKGLLAQASGRKDWAKGPMSANLTECVLGEYNRGRRGSRALTSWRGE